MPNPTTATASGRVEVPHTSGEGRGAGPTGEVAARATHAGGHLGRPANECERGCEAVSGFIGREVRL